MEPLRISLGVFGLETLFGRDPSGRRLQRPSSPAARSRTSSVKRSGISRWLASRRGGKQRPRLAALSDAPGLEASAPYTTNNPAIFVNATHLCTCSRRETGRVQLLRYIVSEDCGPMINPNVVEGQISGGTVQGIGGVLFEHLAYDEDGNPVTTTFMDYLLPTATDVPEIEYGHIETPSAGPGGYKGVGEGGAIGAPPAVINAVADALSQFGVTITRLPLSPSQIVALLDR
jgi:carbon-monoxide dehydrogenase large subunit